MDRRLLANLALISLIGVVCALALVPGGVRSQTDERCFSETGFCISGRIREFWEQNGGLPVFGFPIGPQQEQVIEGQPRQAQWFERNRLELHPENQRPYDVLLGRLGADALQQQGRNWQDFPKSSQQPGCRFFAETGHNVCGEILGAWRANGLEIDGQPGKTEAESLALFGLPLSDVQAETMPDGQERQVQWFERARFELHPENAPPSNVLLGLLGNEVQQGGSTAAQCADVPPPVNAEVRPSDCIPAGSTLEIFIGGFQPREPVGYWLTSPEGDIRGTTEPASDFIDESGRAGLTLNTSQPIELWPGLWSVTFQGTESGHQAIVYFKLLAQGSGPGGGDTSGGDNRPPRPWENNPQCADVQPSVNATLRPGNCLEQGQIFFMDITGFQPNEAVGFWFVRPDGGQSGTRAAVPGVINANGQGSDWWPTASLEPGLWTAVYQGTESGHQAIGYFKVLEPGAIGMTPDTSVYCPEVPDAVNGAIIPSKCVFAGTVVRLGVSGFGGGEQVGFWFTAPDGAVFGTRQTATMPDDGNGALNPLDTGELSLGLWTLVVQGTQTDHTAIVYFKVVEPAPPDQPPPAPEGIQCGDTLLPNPTNAESNVGYCVDAGTRVQITFRGFGANEPLRRSITPPNGQNVPAAGAVNADGSGTYVSAEVDTGAYATNYGRGLYTFVVEGVNSGHLARATIMVR